MKFRKWAEEKGMTYKEIGKAIGMSANTVMTNAKAERMSVVFSRRLFDVFGLDVLLLDGMPLHITDTQQGEYSLDDVVIIAARLKKSAGELREYVDKIELMVTIFGEVMAQNGFIPPDLVHFNFPEIPREYADLM